MGPASPRLLILVPARGGSKGLPGKNIKPLGGIPLLAWTARAIHHSGVAARAVLSTDDPAIAEVGRVEGLEVPFLRPAELAGDRTGMVEVVEHTLGWLESQGGWCPDAIMLLQPTCPFRRPARLAEALSLLMTATAEGVVGVARLDRTPAFLYRQDAEGFLLPLAPWDDATIRQETRPTFTPNGTMYLTTRESLGRHRRLFPPRLRAMPTTEIEGIDIDTPEDWAVAEAVVAAGLVAP
jgi:CMP-N,N'-diacetyllegionaminic acid synthase